MKLGRPSWPPVFFCRTVNIFLTFLTLWFSQKQTPLPILESTMVIGMLAMAFGNKQNSAALQISVDRLAAVAGAPGGAASSSASAVEAPVQRRPRGELQPDPSRIRPRQLEELPEDRKRRLAAKTVNFTATILARIVIIAAAALWAWEQYQYTGQIHRGVAVGIFVMFGDLGRVIMKAAEPGTK